MTKLYLSLSSLDYILLSEVTALIVGSLLLVAGSVAYFKEVLTYSLRDLKAIRLRDLCFWKSTDVGELTNTGLFADEVPDLC